ncbi:hypothetical protein NDU88_008085 [Pleurodeles waltl]|uniref:Uncharacterized protein n=1 Tax=Pleurodeles waltl TaxID=8319 RepID=A0AAV7RTM3_PLEWA|nr:hypothetical protein NDU88_008085 [Pleurodeles waltl]
MLRGLSGRDARALRGPPVPLWRTRGLLVGRDNIGEATRHKEVWMLEGLIHRDSAIEGCGHVGTSRSITTGASKEMQSLVGG